MAAVPSSAGGGAGANPAPATTKSPSNSILTVATEIVGVGLLALLAGANEDVGKLIVVFMVGLWAVFMVTNPAVIAKIASFPQIAAQNG
jgi:hypothetical protein